MKLSALFPEAIKGVKVLFKGDPKPSGVFNREEVEYFMLPLVTPTLVGCSVMPEIGQIEVDVAYVLSTHLDDEGWEKDEKTGEYCRPGWRLDFSKNREFAILGPESIAKWARGERQNKSKDRNDSFLQRIRERQGKK